LEWLMPIEGNTDALWVWLRSFLITLSLQFGVDHRWSGKFVGLLNF
jgi:hypothetical protein